MPQADLTPLPTEALGDPLERVSRPEAPSDITRGTRVIGDESRATAIIAAPSLELIPATDAALADLTRVDLAWGDRAVPATTPPSRPLAAGAALLGVGVAATTACCTLVGGAMDPVGALAAVGVAASVIAQPSALHRCRAIDAPAAALCLGAMTVVLAVAHGEARTAVCIAVGAIAVLGFAWSWTPSAAADRRSPLARIVGAALFVIAERGLSG